MFKTGNICWKFYHKLEVSRGKATTGLSETDKFSVILTWLSKTSWRPETMELESKVIEILFTTDLDYGCMDVNLG